MAHDFPLEEMGPRAFEQLTVALALKVLGPGVEAFGAGPDGGREATYRGTVNWSATTNSRTDSWNGYVVIQAKQRQHELGDVRDNALWLQRQINDELDAWMHSKRRGEFPHYIIFVTNVRLSSVSGSGGIDSINAAIAKRWKGDGISKNTLHRRGLRGWRIWHRDQLNALLSVHGEIRDAFPAMLTVGDVLTRLSTLSTLLAPQELHAVLTSHAWTTLTSERWVNLSEAGDSNRQSVENVIIDLEARGPDREETTTLTEIISRGDTVLKASMNNGQPRHLVLTGQPGNGKTTVGRFITQLYRARFMSEDIPTGKAVEVMEGTRRALARLKITAPLNRRWPLRIELAQFADALGPSGEMSLLRWLGERVSKRADIDIVPAELKRWMRHWPWIVVLDGLDEVTSPEVRRRVLDEIESFVEEVDRADADVLLVVTTRPTGYTERVAPEHFAQYDLQYLNVEAAIGYGTLVTSQRLVDDLDRRDEVLRRFTREARDSAMARLMKTPLQVLIITIILERLGSLPPDRYQLFWRYYETIYDRELSKNTSLRSLLMQHRSAITSLHEAVGLTVHSYAETDADARALLPAPEVRRLTERRLLGVGHQPGPDLGKLASRIVNAATHRLVLLVPGEDDTVTFEIRSLQELMAARALTNGTDDQVNDILTLTASSPHWRNTWVFAAGRLFAESPDHRRDLITNIVETIDQRDDWPSWLCPVGPGLAADLLEDGLSTTMPKWQRRLIDVALRALESSSIPDGSSLVNGLKGAATTTNNRMYIKAALQKALAGRPSSRSRALDLINEGSFGTIAHQGSRQSVKDEPTAKNQDSEGLGLGTILRESLTEVEHSQAISPLIEAALAELDTVVLTREGGRLTWTASSKPWPSTTVALRSTEASGVLELLFGALDVNCWSAQEMVAKTIWASLSRVDVGQQVLAAAGLER